MNVTESCPQTAGFFAVSPSLDISRLDARLPQRRLLFHHRVGAENGQ
jgi:hypothetical protein